jgi:hypothetical protein
MNIKAFKISGSAVVYLGPSIAIRLYKSYTRLVSIQGIDAKRAFARPGYLRQIGELLSGPTGTIERVSTSA